MILYEEMGIKLSKEYTKDSLVYVEKYKYNKYRIGKNIAFYKDHVLVTRLAMKAGFINNLFY